MSNTSWLLQFFTISRQLFVFCIRVKLVQRKPLDDYKWLYVASRALCCYSGCAFEEDGTSKCTVNVVSCQWRFRTFVLTREKQALPSTEYLPGRHATQKPRFPSKPMQVVQMSPLFMGQNAHTPAGLRCCVAGHGLTIRIGSTLVSPGRWHRVCRAPSSRVSTKTLLTLPSCTAQEKLAVSYDPSGVTVYNRVHDW